MTDVSLADRAYVELRSAVMDRRLTPGSGIAEAGLAKMLGVSRTPVREALLRCELEGYLTRDASGRLVIGSPTAEMVEQLFEIRAKIEGYAVRRAVTCISEAELSRLDELVSEDFEALSRPRTKRLVEINAEVHGTILEASRNRTLVSLMKSLHGQSHGLSSFAVGNHEDRTRFVEDHRSLVALLRDGDAVGAAALIRSHLDHACDLIIRGMAN